MNNKPFFWLSFLWVLAAFTFKGDDYIYRSLPNKDFSKGERFKYSAHYLGFNGGEAVITMDPNLQRVNGRNCYMVNVTGKTVGMAAFFYEVNDMWRSYIDTGAITTQKFYRKIEEGKSYRLEETTTFYHQSRNAHLVSQKGNNYKAQTFPIKPYPQDMISGYYYLRTIDYNKKKAGDIISMYAVYEDTIYDFKIKYLGKEVVKTKFGKINAFAMSPIMPDNKLFDGGDAITFWVSDDRNRVPLKVKAKMFVAPVTIELEEHSGLKYPFNFAK